MERVIHDELEECPYLPDRQARMPLRWQFEPILDRRFDASLERGDRRVGQMLYRTACPTCTACEPIRVPVADFAPSRSQKRVLKRNQDLQVQVGPVRCTDEQLELFNRHKFERGLARRETPMTRRGYVSWLQDTCTRTIEVQYRRGGRLIGVGILDLGQEDTSSVYFYFDPDEGKRSLGVFSVLIELDWLRRRGGRFHYLGLYVEGCRALDYKSGYYPHERRIDGAWERFEK